MEEVVTSNAHLRLYKISTCPHGKVAEDIIFRLKSVFPNHIHYDIIFLGNLSKTYHEAFEDDYSVSDGKPFRVGFRRNINDFNFDVLSDQVEMYDHANRYICPTLDFFVYDETDRKKKRILSIFGIDEGGEVFEYLILLYLEYTCELYWRERSRDIYSRHEEEIKDIYKKIRDFYKK